MCHSRYTEKTSKQARTPLSLQPLWAGHGRGALRRKCGCPGRAQGTPEQKDILDSWRATRSPGLKGRVCGPQEGPFRGRPSTGGTTGGHPTQEAQNLFVTFPLPPQTTSVPEAGRKVPCFASFLLLVCEGREGTRAGFVGWDPHCAFHSCWRPRLRHPLGWHLPRPTPGLPRPFASRPR